MSPADHDFADLKLTEWTSCGGCAAKWGASLLTDLVRDMPAGADPSLLVGLAPFDDAAIYQVSPDVALVSTTDFFPPLVDHPSDFGAIAAANACSDVFAMGGRVVVAVNVAAFPEHFPREAIVAIARRYDLQIIDDDCYALSVSDLPSLRAMATLRWFMSMPMAGTLWRASISATIVPTRPQPMMMTCASLVSASCVS